MVAESVAHLVLDQLLLLTCGKAAGLDTPPAAGLDTPPRCRVRYSPPLPG